MYTDNSCLELFIGMVLKRAQEGGNQDPETKSLKQEEARRSLSRRGKKGSKAATGTVTNKKICQLSQQCS